MRLFYISFIVVILFSNCSKGNGDISLFIGEDFFESNTKVFFIDTLTVNAGTIKFDSIVAPSNRFLIGSYNDLTFGKTQSKTFIQLRSNSYIINDEAVYDSIALVLKPDGYFYNDTIPEQHFKVHEVLDDIEPNEEDYSYYNTSNFNYNNTPLGEKRFFPRPQKKDSIEIKLNDNFGKSIFTDILEKDITNQDEFIDKYKGIVVTSESNNTTVLGFLNTSNLRIYYTEKDNDGNDIEQVLEINPNTANSFNQISSNRDNTFFDTLDNQEIVVPSSATNKATYIQAGVGLLTRLDIPYVNTLYDISPDGIITNARLRLSLKKNTFSNNLYTKDSLILYAMDDKSNLLPTLLSSTSTAITAYVIDKNSETQNIDYVADITPFIKVKQIETYENYFLAIYSQNYSNSVDRYVLDDTTDTPIKLELNYATY